MWTNQDSTQLATNAASSVVCLARLSSSKLSFSKDRADRAALRFPSLALLVVALLLGLTQPLGADSAQSGDDPFLSFRREMIENQVRRRGIEEPKILSALELVPRHLFVPEGDRLRAYEDVPIEIGPDQTLSQAYLSAQMVSLLDLDGDEKVLEIGTGSGYDAALLSRLAREVWTVEISPRLADAARRTLSRLGYKNVHVETGDGYRGLPGEAPFDAILLTAAPQHIPEPLIEQLAVGGKMVVAVGDFFQDLLVVTKNADGSCDKRRISPVRLGPMTGEAAEKDPG